MVTFSEFSGKGFVTPCHKFVEIFAGRLGGRYSDANGKAATPWVTALNIKSGNFLKEDRGSGPRWTAACHRTASSVGRYQFDPAILRATFVSIVGSDEVGLAEAARSQPRGRNAVVFEVPGHRISPALR